MEPSREGNRRILVVDDNQDIHADFRKLLGPDDSDDALNALAAELFGLPPPRAKAPAFELSFAAQGADGLEMVAKSAAAGMPYALVFMDMRMPPGWDGMETLERIWAIDPFIQAVICTAHSDYSWSQITERLGSTDRLLILKKPFDSLEVRQLALAMTEKWNAARERASTEAHLRALLRERDARRSSVPLAEEDVADDRRITLADEPLPVVPVHSGVIVVPLVGEHDARRMELVAGALVSAVLSRAARVLVLDGSCLTMTDSEALPALRMATVAVESTGCRVIWASLPDAPEDGAAEPLLCGSIDEGIQEALSIVKEQTA